jgi:L-threonylcarbamoyladenylate synthase
LEELTDKPPVIKTDKKDNLRAGLARAGQILLTGGAVAFPTETFYGLAVNALNEGAIGRLFTIKKRRSDSPVLILIPSLECLGRYVEQVPETARIHMKKFWPGGLTLLFRAGPSISRLLTAGTGKIGIRLSSHPIATGLAKAIDAPITGTSANISGQPPCTNADEVLHSLKDRVDLILDGGETIGGKGSTILDVTADPPRILREGTISADELGL